LNIGSHIASLEYRITDMVRRQFAGCEEIWIRHAGRVFWCWRFSAGVRGSTDSVISSPPCQRWREDDAPMTKAARHCCLRISAVEKIRENGTCAYVCECVLSFLSPSSLLRTIRSHTHSLTHTFFNDQSSLRPRTGDMLPTHTYSYMRR
jgi:hypothetical protein